MSKQLTLIFTLSFLLASCGKSPTEARKELAQLDIPFEESTCQEYAAKGDEIVIDLFSATNMDSGCLLSGAVETGNTDLVKQALKQEFAPDNKYAELALGQAIQEQKDDIAKLLVKGGVQSPEAFASAIDTNNLELVKLFLDRGMNPNYGIIRAAKSKNLEIAKLLLAKGADANYNPENENAENSYALCVAADFGQKEMVQLLLDNKANPNSKYQYSCLAYALSKDNQEVAQMLRQAGATDTFLTGKWEITYNVESIMDSTGDVRDTYDYTTKYANLTHNKSTITGNLVDGGEGCADAKINGKIVDNSVNWTLEYTGSCCPQTKSTYQGTVDYDLTSVFGGGIKIAGNMEPKGKPAPNCSMWFANFTATQSR